jgi:dTDP-4-dehydrorhamnose 3,5-epimerase
VPQGFAHGFVVRSEVADFLYKCSDYYDAADDYGVLWNDPELGIEWDTSSPIISAKDQRHLPLFQVAPDRLPVYQP